MTLQAESIEPSATAPLEEPSHFNERGMHTLALLCDTLVPAIAEDEDPHGLYERCASDLDVPRLLALAIEQFAEPALVWQLRLFLQAIENPLVNMLLSGQNRAFSEMSLDERTELLRAWQTSRFNFRRKTFQSLKRLALLLFYSVTAVNQHNPNWPAIGYSGPPKPPTQPKTTIRPLVIDTETTLYTDVVIVGSGAGGGVVAGELSAAGLDVIVLEKGGYYTEADFDGLELRSYERMFENRGLLTNHDLGMVILAGSTLGGGTTINWSASFRTPDYVLEEWASQYGVREFVSERYQTALDAVTRRINANTDNCPANPQNAVLEAGAKKLNLSNGLIPRNVKGCTECGFCNFGCPHGTKQSTMRTYLQDAYDRGSRIVVRAHVERVLVEYGRAVGVAAMVTDTEGRRHRLTVRAKTVVVAAGSLHSPVILLRSGLGNAHIGRNLHLHPTTVMYGIYDEPVRGWSGPMMSRYVDAFRNLDGQSYGVTLETAPIHPGIGALTLSWADGWQHKDTMRQLENLANTIILTRDLNSGRVTVNERGKLVVHYPMGREDAVHMMRGVVEGIRIHAAAGAREIGAPFAVPVTWRRDRENLETYLDTVRRMKFVPNNFALFSAHQMSSCRMASSPVLGAVAPNGETFEVRGLYVADASVLPSASGVNPMVTIMATAHTIAGYIKDAHSV